MTVIIADFLDPGELVDSDLRLVVNELVPSDEETGFVPSYRFSMMLEGVKDPVGGIDLRLGDTIGLVRYGGHIGYGVEEQFRGQHLAARSCRLVFGLARRHGFKELWITCNPDNLASRRTLEIAGGEFVEIVDLPPGSDMYERGDRFKCRYRFDLEALLSG